MKSSKPIPWDWWLLGTLIGLLLVHYSKIVPQSIDGPLLVVFSAFATVPVLLSAIRALRNRQISVDLLASIALIASLLTQQWASAAFINLMLTSARLFGSYTDRKARAAIESLFKLRPQTVKVQRGGTIQTIPAEQIKVGDLVVIETGERIPIDGVVVEGEASIDQSSLTGESVPVAKKVGDTVLSSTLNEAGSLIVRAEKIGKDTTLEKIIALVEQSQESKGKIHTAGERFAGWYIALTLVGSVIVWFIFHDGKLLLSLLLVACADDIAIALPMAFLAAIGYAAHRGVIIKGSNFLEGLTKIKTMVVDKTGTLTLGKLSVQQTKTFGSYTQGDLLKLGGIAETSSEHPFAKAIMRYVEENKIELEEATAFKEVPGNGTTASYDGKTISSGKIEFLQHQGVLITAPQQAEIEAVKTKGLNVTLVGYGEELVGYFAYADEIRPQAASAIAQLRSLGITRWVMLTGDNEHVASRVAQTVKMDEYHADLLPQDKLTYLKQNLKRPGKVGMIGDGVNDAAALSLADVGIAMGAIGSDTAIEAADVALMKDDFTELPEIVKLGRYTMRVARQDFWIWGIVNLIGLILVFGRIIGPEGAASYNFVTDFFPLVNSMRLFNLHRQVKS